MLLILPSPAKLNLFLYITGRRADGYHNLQTLFQFLDFSDELTFTPTSNGKITLSTTINNIPKDNNLIIIAAKLLQAYSQTICGAEITLTKKIPIGGGLGGASSNAATTLLALNHLWNCNLNSTVLLKLASKIGADVAVFVHGHAAFAEGIGDQLYEITPIEYWYLVVNPNIHVSTAEIFNASELPRNTTIKSLETLLSQPFYNDCEKTVRKRYPKIDQLLSWLSQFAPARLTGTGASVFAQFTSKQAAENILNRLPDKNYAFVARGMNRSPLHTALQYQLNNK